MHEDFKELFGKPDARLQKLFYEVSYPWDLLEKLVQFLEMLPLGEIHGFIDPKADVRDLSKIYLGKGAEIGPGALIEGPVYLADRVKVRHGAYIRGPAYIAEGAVIGHASEIKHSIFFERATAAHFNYVGNSILGYNVQLGAGATCANLRFDRRAIVVRSAKSRFATEHIKMGALIGKESKLGCQAVLSPGAVLEKDSIVPPLLSVQGYYQRVK